VTPTADFDRPEDCAGRALCVRLGSALPDRVVAAPMLSASRARMVVPMLTSPVLSSHAFRALNAAGLQLSSVTVRWLKTPFVTDVAKVGPTKSVDDCFKR